jgi:F-type H+-transporting ATPase subunit a
MDLSHIFLSKKFLSRSFWAFLFSFGMYTSLAQAAPVQDSIAIDTAAAHAGTEKEENISEVILHHIADSHEWHLFGHYSIPLPVILWDNGKLVTFMSSRFEHDDSGSKVVEQGGFRLVKYHGKIYHAAEGAEAGHHIVYNSSKEVANAKPFDLSITKNVFSLLISIAILLVVFIGVGNSYKNREGKAPKGMQSLIEPFILFVRDDIAKPQLGHRWRGFMPYLLTVFFFIWINNILGLIPFFPGGANLTGNIAVTMMLALCTFVITLVNGNKNYWGHIFTPHVPWWLYPLMIPVEIIGIFTKPIALMIRLFANITAGHILILSLISLIFILKSVFVAGVAVPFVLFISVIELVVGFIQAFIFTILSALFIGMAVEEHSEH